MKNEIRMEALGKRDCASMKETGSNTDNGE